jgi:hypothetical protein
LPKLPGKWSLKLSVLVQRFILDSFWQWLYHKYIISEINSCRFLMLLSATYTLVTSYFYLRKIRNLNGTRSLWRRNIRTCRTSPTCCDFAFRILRPSSESKLKPSANENVFSELETTRKSKEKHINI